MEKIKMTRGAAIKEYFSNGPHGRPVTMDELKALMKSRPADALGVSVETTVTAA